MNIKTALQKAKNELTASGIKTAALDAEVLLAFVLQKPKEFLYTYPEQLLTPQQARMLTRLIKRRADNEPVAYLIGHKEFYGLDFYIDKRVLVPRPETELIVDEIIDYLSHPTLHPPLSGAGRGRVVIADIGTGSGCVAITLAKNLPRIKIYATDISGAALTVAKKNARKHKVRITFRRGDLLQPLKNKRIDIITANLPYGALRGTEKFVWNKSVHHALRHEPNIALNGGAKGLAVIEKLLKQIAASKIQPRLLLLEFDPYQKSELQKILKKYLKHYHVTIKKDLARYPRLAIVHS